MPTTPQDTSHSNLRTRNSSNVTSLSNSPHSTQLASYQQSTAGSHHNAASHQVSTSSSTPSHHHRHHAPSSSSTTKKFYSKDSKRFFTSNEHSNASMLTEAARFSSVTRWNYHKNDREKEKQRERKKLEGNKKASNRSCWSRICCSCCCCFSRRAMFLMLLLFCLVCIGYGVFVVAFWLTAQGEGENVTPGTATPDWMHWRDQIRNAPILRSLGPSGDYVEGVKKWWGSEDEKAENTRVQVKQEAQSSAVESFSKEMPSLSTPGNSQTAPLIKSSDTSHDKTTFHDEELHHFFNEQHSDHTADDHFDETHKLFFEEFGEWEDEIVHGHLDHSEQNDGQRPLSSESTPPDNRGSVNDKKTDSLSHQDEHILPVRNEEIQSEVDMPPQDATQSHKDIQSKWESLVSSVSVDKESSKDSSADLQHTSHDDPPTTNDQTQGSIEKESTLQAHASNNATQSDLPLLRTTPVATPQAHKTELQRISRIWKSDHRTTIYSLHFEQDILRILRMRNASVSPVLIRIGTEGFTPSNLNPSTLQYDLEGGSHWISVAMEHSLISSDVVWLHAPHGVAQKEKRPQHQAAFFSELYVPVLGHSPKCGQCYYCPHDALSPSDRHDWCQELREIPSSFCECSSRKEMTHQKMFMCESVTSIPMIASSRVSRLIRREHPYIVSVDESYFHGVPHDFSIFFPKGSILESEFRNLKNALENKSKFCSPLDTSEKTLTEWLHKLIQTPHEEWSQTLPVVVEQTNSNSTVSVSSVEDKTGLLKLWCDTSHARADLIEIQKILLRIAYSMNYISWKWLMDRGFPTVGCNHDASNIYGLCTPKIESALEIELRDLLKRFSIPPEFVTVLKSDALVSASNENINISMGVAERLHDLLQQNADFMDWTSTTDYTSGSDLLYIPNGEESPKTSELSVSYQTKQKMIQLLEQFMRENSISSLVRFMKSHYTNYVRWLQENAPAQHDSLDQSHAMEEEGKAQDLYARFIEIERLFTSS
eukprot:CAMPEP_0117451048 /NCGR_PEP_ID=MMETSP0759-20121206/8796_1 /TAXON_ID=63605 /ORGANISM="Percolomonas cosmopolitus, Strain WS" /LENGTH=991 /DNA_ID=CAMNT_0005243615 /DNA_START=27 /DNA_END=2998 /DNA_ORIENTATION=+